MAKKKQHVYDDPAGREWQGKADEAWAVAEGRAEQLDDPDQPAIAFYDAPPLPDFNDGKPAHVKRELLGRYLYDGAVVHDCHSAKPSCKVDAVRNGTFYHFGHEVPDDLQPCPNCAGG